MMKKNVLTLITAVAALMCSPAGLVQCWDNPYQVPYQEPWDNPYQDPYQELFLQIQQDRLTMQALRLLNINVPDQKDELLNRLADGIWIVYCADSPNSIANVLKFGYGEWRVGDTNILLGMEDVKMTHAHAPAILRNIANFRQTYKGRFSPAFQQQWGSERMGLMPPEIKIVSVSQFAKAAVRKDSEIEIGGKKYPLPQGTSSVLIKGERVEMALSGLKNSFTYQFFPLEHGEWVGRMEAEYEVYNQWGRPEIRRESSNFRMVPLIPFQPQQQQQTPKIEVDIVP